MFYCDPPGYTAPENLFNVGRDDIVETDFIFFHDQEPVWMDLHKPLFDEIEIRNLDITHKQGPDRPRTGTSGHVVVSERGEYVDQMCARYGWQPHYYWWWCIPE